MSPVRIKNPRHVYDVLRPLLFLSKVFGFIAFELNGDPPYVQMKATLANYVSLVFNFVGNGLCVFLNNQNLQLSRKTGSAVLDHGLNIMFLFAAMTAAVLAVESFFRRKSTCAIMAELYELDRSLQRKNHQVHHKHHLQVLFRILVVAVLLVAFGTIFSLLAMLVSTFSLRNHLINAFSYAFTGMQYLIINIHFICAGRLVAFRLYDIERCIKRHLKQSSWVIEQKNRWGRNVDPIFVIDELAEDVAALIRIVNQINRFYANQILGCILGVAMFSIFIIYASIYSVFTGMMQELLLSSIFLIAWIFYVFMIVHIFIAGEEVARASGAIIFTVNKAILLVKDKHMERKLIYLSQQMLLQGPILGCLFCKFKWKTMYSIGGFIVTYLVILMQFDEITEKFPTEPTDSY